MEKKTTYSGSTSCLECHKEEFSEWKESHHGLAERSLFPLEKIQITSDHKTYIPERVIGHDPLRQFLVRFPGGRYQATENALDPNRNEWFNVFGKEKRRPGEWGHWTGRGMNWNSNCASCHNTNLQKNYDEKNDSYNTTMSEMAVSCESCHGPLREHGLWQKSNKGPDPTIRKFTKDQIIETCASCHSRRQDLTGKFRPGDSFHDHYKLTIVDASDTFYPDGQIRGENYEYSSFLGSKMYEKGVRCIDCHNPHTAKLRLPGNLMCLKCHDGSEPNAPVINPSQHSFHKVDDLSKIENRDKKKVAKMGGECINCHMPQTVYMQRHPRHDHGFTTPDPLLTKTHGIPNACNRCHQDKSVDWSIKWTDKWYGKKMERPSRSRAQTIANARRGDPSSILKLIEMVKGDESSYWKAAAIELLAPNIEDPSVSEILRSALSNTSPLIREKASGLVGSNLKDPVRSVRFNLAWLKRSTIDLNSPEGKELKEIIDFNADQPTGRMQKGNLYLSRGNSLEALKHYNKAEDWDPFSAPLHHDIAIILAGINQIDQATTHLKKAIELDPNDADYRLKLGLALSELGKTKEAIESFKMAVKLDPNFANAWYNLGLSLNSIGDKKNAKEALRKGLKADPNDLRIRNALKP